MNAGNKNMNSQMMEYRREAKEKWDLWSPYRLQKYVEFRLKGLSPEKSIAKVRSK